MTTTKKTTPKKKTAKPKVEMVSYAIKMVIPTGQYANIQPEIIVKANSVEEAHEYIAPHMNKLWREYYLVNERRPEPTQETGTTGPMTIPTGPTGPATPPDSNVALIKATQAIESCLSLDAFEIIANQVNVSVKLTDEDKSILKPLLEKKLSKLEDK